jgi:hypothetical protein
MVAAAVVAGSVASAAIGASAQSSAAKKAAKAQTAAADAATNLQREMYYDQRGLLAPSISAGARAQAQRMLMQGYSADEVKAFLRSTEAALALDQDGGVGLGGVGGGGGRNPVLARPPTTIDMSPDDYAWVDNWSYESSSPSYGFRFDEGQRALERSKAASGDYFSGDTAAALTRYGQDYASTEFESDWRRLGELAGQGAQDTGTVVQVGGNFGQQAGANIMEAGRARATGYQDAGQAWGTFWGEAVPGALGSMYTGGWGKK